MTAWEAGAGPTVRRQGSRFARPLRRLAALTVLRWPGSLAAMRSWLAVRDCAHAAREARGRSTAAWRGVDVGRSVDRPRLPQWCHGFLAQIAASMCAGRRGLAGCSTRPVGV